MFAWVCKLLITRHKFSSVMLKRYNGHLLQKIIEFDRFSSQRNGNSLSLCTGNPFSMAAYILLQYKANIGHKK